MPDWEAIQRDYENGLSLRVLAAKYGVSKSAIHKHCGKPSTLVAVDTGRTKDGHSVDSGQASTPTSTDIVELAKRLVAQLAQTVDAPPDLKEHSQIANALSQYNKIIATAPAQEHPKGIDWSIFEQEELDIIQPIFAQAEERKRVEAGETGIPQLRKQQS